MAKPSRAGVSTSFTVFGKQRLRRFVVTRVTGKCLASYTLLREKSDRPAVTNRSDWGLFCTLDGKKLPIGPDPYSNTGWRIEQELTPQELKRVVCNPRLLLKEAS